MQFSLDPSPRDRSAVRGQNWTKTGGVSPVDEANSFPNKARKI